MYHVGMSVFDRLKIFDAFTNAGLPEQAGRDLSDVLEEGAEGLAKKTDMDRMLDRVHLMFAEHEARMVNQMSKMMLAQYGVRCGCCRSGCGDHRRLRRQVMRSAEVTRGSPPLPAASLPRRPH